jgi:hypothetical protein
MQVYGRVVPQVLLAHVGAWGAATLPDVLDPLEAAGARYITLPQALSDPAYSSPGDGMLIERTAKARDVALSEPTESRLNLASLCQ